MAHLKIISLGLLLVLSSCVSNEELWKGSVQDFTSQYVEELRRMGTQEKVESHGHHINKFSPLLNSFFIETASAKTKKRPKKKPLILKTSEVRKIQKSQAKRMTQIDRYKVKKIIGEKENGLIGIRTSKGLSEKQKDEVADLVRLENKDRNKLYGIISKASGYDKKAETVLRKSFFDSYQEWAPTGTYYYTNNKWQKK